MSLYYEDATQVCLLCGGLLTSPKPMIIPEKNTCRQCDVNSATGELIFSAIKKHVHVSEVSDVSEISQTVSGRS